MLEISNNSCMKARMCWKMFWWYYVMKLEPVTKSIALSLGSVMHEAFDMHYKGAGDMEILKYIGTRFDDEISKQEAADQEELKIAKYTALGMWLNYPYKVNQFQEVHSEEMFNVRLGTKLRGVRLVGKVDGRVKKNNVLWVRELKISGLTVGQLEARAQVSGQASTYIYGERKSGYPVEGVLYDYIKRPLLRKGVKDTVDSFGERIFQDYKTRPEMYYAKSPIYTYRNPVQLALYERDTERLALEIRRRLRTGDFYRNRDQCWNFGSECAYKKICFQEPPDPLTLQLYFKVKGENTHERESENTEGV